MRATLEKALIRNHSKTFLRVNSFLGFVTVLSVLAISFETVDELSEYTIYFDVIEYF